MTDLQLTWLLIGFSLIIFEFVKLPGIGLLFMGLGAISVPFMLEFLELSNYQQLGYFGIFSFAWFVVLYYPLSRIMPNNKSHSEGNNFDLKGATVIVTQLPGTEDEEGYFQVNWSGSSFNAQIIKNKTAIKIADKLTVIDIRGNILICEPVADN